MAFSTQWFADRVEVLMKINHYNQDETPIVSKSIINYQDTLIASNIRFVDVADGCELYSEDIGTEVDSEGNHIPKIVYKRVDTNAIITQKMPQFEFFDYLCRNVPVSVITLLTNFIQVEDQIRHRWDN